MPKPTAAALLVAFSLAACGGKTIEVSRTDGTTPEPPAPYEPEDPNGPPVAPPPPTTPSPTPAPTPLCGPSFRYNVLLTLKERGCSNTSCHGGATPRNEPRIDLLDFYGTWNDLRAFTLSTGQPYVSSVPSTPAVSGMHCHLRGECGVSMSSLVVAGALSPKELADIDAWLACGAPFN